MSNIKSAVGGFVALAVLISGGSLVASAQQGGALAPTPAPAVVQDPNKITVSTRTYDRQALVSVPVLPENVYKGRTIWLQRCAYCHDGVGQPSYKTMGPWLGAETLDRLSEPGFRALVGFGTSSMPGFRYALDASQINDLIAFVKTVSSDQKPTAAQLAGRAPGAGNGD